MIGQDTMKNNNYFFEIKLNEENEKIKIKNLITNKELYISLFKTTELEMSNVFEFVIDFLWKENYENLLNYKTIDLTKINKNVDDINSQILLTFANLFSKEIELVRTDILNKKQEISS